MDNRIRLIPILVGLVLIGGMLVYGCKEGPFGRKQLVTMSPEQELQLGTQAFAQVLSKYRNRVLPRDHPLSRAIQEVGLRLAKSAEDPQLRKQIHLPRLKFEWEFRVVDDKQVNAFCLPGGKVVFYTGILPVCATDAGVAVVMGHEIAHALARHGAERMAQQQIAQIGQVAAAVSLSDADPRTQQSVMAALGLGTQVGFLLPYSRKHESEADHIGLLLMAHAGYEPVEAVEFWQRMERASSSRGQPEFLSTHPSHGTRIEQLRGWLKEAQPLYEKSNRRRPQRLPLSSR